MQRYRTEILIPSDRFVCLQLPDRLPAGKAIVTVVFHPQTSSANLDDLEPNPDEEDIEWWDEFDEETELAPPKVIPGKASASPDVMKESTPGTPSS